MSYEKQVAAFATWMDGRSAEYARRMGFTHSDPRRTLLKTEAAELTAIRAAFSRMVVEPLPPIEQAMFLSRVDIQQQRAAEPDIQ